MCACILYSDSDYLMLLMIYSVKCSCKGTRSLVQSLHDVRCSYLRLSSFPVMKKPLKRCLSRLGQPTVKTRQCISHMIAVL